MQQVPKTSRSLVKPINLALQGGGSHGALTWGVLDRLLEDRRLSIRGISGTSAGAMNAVVFADGHERGGPEGAREALGRFWKAISDSAQFSPIRRSMWDKLWGRYSLDYSPGYLFFESLSRVFSPYELNPMGLNPLRDLLVEQVDFNNVNRCPDVRVYVTATNVRTGRPRIFGQGEVTVDSVMASACLPQMFQAVEIGGEAYWDGGFYRQPRPLSAGEKPDDSRHPCGADQPDRAARPAEERPRHHEPGERDQLQFEPDQGTALDCRDAARSDRKGDRPRRLRQHLLTPDSCGHRAAGLVGVQQAQR